jgi:RNA polymerase sigma factor (sigma-70 family)
MTTDLDLLGQFNRDHSQDAFTEIVRRHVNLVYSAALRQVRSPQLAEEVAQSVFTDLARNAGKFKPDTVLTAWLYQVTRRTAVDVVRKESRRQLREQIGLEMNAMNATASDWTHVEPFLDEAMHTLDETDRAAVLLRYFENKSLREVGQTLGTSDDAAQKRVSRAVERLREFLSKRGVTVGASGLVVVISANAVHAAPVELAAVIASTAVLAGTTAHASTMIAAGKIIAMTTLQKVAVTATIATVFGAGIYEAHRAIRLAEQAQMSLQHPAPLVEQVQQLQRERDEAKNRLALLADELSTLKSNSAELLRLRGQATRLGKVSQELARFEAAGGSFSQLEKDLAFANKYPGPRWKAFLEQDALDNLARLKEIGGLTPDQEQSVRELLLKPVELKDQAMQEEFEGAQTQEGKAQFSQSYSNLNEQINALLSPDQQAALQASRQRGTEAMARMYADGELVMLQQSVGISREREGQIFPILYDFALKQRTGDSASSTEETDALANILTPAQMELCRKVMQERSVRVVMQAVQK